MTNKEKFLNLVSSEKTNSISMIRERIKNRETLKESQKIAIKVLSKLDEIGWSQKKLADVMGVSPQQITKIVSGKENQTTDTIIKLQNILDIDIFLSSYERRQHRIYETISAFGEFKKSEILHSVAVEPKSVYLPATKIIQMPISKQISTKTEFNSQEEMQM